MTESRTHCPACGGPLQPWRDVRSGEPSDERTYTLLRCERCGSAVTDGPPPGPEAYETGVYAPSAPRARRLMGTLQRALARAPARILRREGVAPGSAVLDVGAGAGRLVGALRRAGYEASGIEPSPRSARRAAAAGLPVIQRGWEAHEAADLDAVVLWHVLEHLDEPGPVLERVGSWLRPGGVLLLGLPNPASWQAVLAGDAWLHWDAPRHRVHLTPDGTEALLRGAGLVPARTRHFVLEHNPGAMWMAMLSRAGLPPGYPFHLVKRNVPVRPGEVARLAAGLPLLPVALVAETLAAAARRSGTVAVPARRR